MKTQLEQEKQLTTDYGQLTVLPFGSSGNPASRQALMPPTRM
jgi:hypothetical protein